MAMVKLFLLMKMEFSIDRTSEVARLWQNVPDIKQIHIYTSPWSPLKVYGFHRRKIFMLFLKSHIENKNTVEMNKDGYLIISRRHNDNHFK